MRFCCKLAFALALLLAVPLFGQQQQDSTPPPQQSAPPSKDASAKKQAKTPGQPQKKPSEAEQNPFPETQSEAAAHHAAQQADQSAPSAPAPQPTGAPPSDRQARKPSETDQNPFPESKSEKAAGEDPQQSSSQQKPAAQAPSSSSGAPPGQDDSSSKLPGFTPPPDLDSSKADEGDGTTADPALARKDTQVGAFYLQSGNYKGAYDRFAEAVRIDPGSADAVFGLADAARRLNRRDEAIRNYRLYLAALPDGPHAKEVRKALRDMGVSPNS
jgi:tetratricopeptide (TPR) repeat protein